MHFGMTSQQNILRMILAGMIFKQLKSFSEKRSSQRNGCVYCLHNGESVDLAESHVMRHPLTKEIICPILKEKP